MGQTNMTIKFTCEECGQHISATDDMMGQDCRCPNEECSKILRVPAESAVFAAPQVESQPPSVEETKRAWTPPPLPPAPRRRHIPPPPVSPKRAADAPAPKLKQSVEVTDAPETCPLCGKGEHMEQPKNLYGQWVCQKCHGDFKFRRYAAFCIDLVLITPVIVILGVPLLCCIFDKFFSCFGRDFAIMSDGNPLWVVVMFQLLGLAFAFKDGFLGHSPGKGICGLRAINERTGKPVGPIASFKRNLALVVPIFLLGFTMFYAAFTVPGGHRFGDGWAKTRVIWKKYQNSSVFTDVESAEA